MLNTHAGLWKDVLIEGGVLREELTIPWRAWENITRQRKEMADNRSVSLVIHVYKSLDGYPASLGFPVMHRVHAMAYAPNLKGKGRFVNGWFVNILPPLKFPSLPCSHAPSLSRSISPPLTSSLPSFPRAVHASFGPFLARSLQQPSP